MTFLFEDSLPAAHDDLQHTLHTLKTPPSNFLPVKIHTLGRSRAWRRDPVPFSGACSKINKSTRTFSHALVAHICIGGGDTTSSTRVLRLIQMCRELCNGIHTAPSVCVFAAAAATHKDARQTNPCVSFSIGQPRRLRGITHTLQTHSHVTLFAPRCSLALFSLAVLGRPHTLTLVMPHLCFHCYRNMRTFGISVHFTILSKCFRHVYALSLSLQHGRHAH